MSLSQNELYRFDEFELNRLKRTLLRSGEPVMLSPKAFEVLTCLVLNPGRVVSKEELLRAAWPESFVEEGNLAQQISSLRRALGDRAGYIVTVPGRGYQFTAQVTQEQTATLSATSATGAVMVQRVTERARMVIEEPAAPELALPAPKQQRWPWAIAGLAVTLAAGGGWFAWSRAHTPRPGDYHQIVVADFDNRTGEDVFDYILKNALEIDLEQSPLLTPLSVGQVKHTMAEMSKPPDAHLTPDVAREVCERNGAQAYVDGSVIKLDASYVITIEAADCVSGKQLVKLETQAKSKDATLPALDGIVAKMRHQLGESLRSVKGLDVPIEQSTTSSFDALVAYSRGIHAGTGPESIPYFQRAIQLDPNFAMAYEQLGVSYGNMMELKTAAENFAKAYELRQPVDAYQQFTITSRYYEIVQNDLDLAAKNYELWARSYPLNAWVWATLANTYTQMGYYPEAIAAGERSLAVDRNYGFGYVVLSRAYKRASEFDKAKAVCNEALSRHIDAWGIHSILFQIAVYELDSAAMERETDWDKDKPSHNQTLDNAGYAAATMGQMQRSEEFLRQAISVTPESEAQDYSADIDADLAETELLLGDTANARTNADKVPLDREEVTFEAAINAALSGDIAYARKAIEINKKAPPSSTLVQKVRIPLLEAAIALSEGKPAQVPALLQPAKVYELRDYYVPTLMGRAFLETHRPEEAAMQYREIVNNPGIDPVSPMWPLGHLGLARALAMEGKTEESRKEYDVFFALWKDADPNVPVLVTARNEYQRLGPKH